MTMPSEEKLGENVKEKREGKNIKKSKICTRRENKSKGKVSKGALCILKRKKRKKILNMKENWGNGPKIPTDLNIDGKGL